MKFEFNPTHSSRELARISKNKELILFDNEYIRRIPMNELNPSVQLAIILLNALSKELENEYPNLAEKIKNFNVNKLD